MGLTHSQQKLTTGDRAPDFAILGTSGRTHTLAQYRGKPTLIVFMCNHCPFVQQKFAAINGLAKRFAGRLHVVGINSNDAAQYPQDDYLRMKEVAAKEGFVFDYLVDETQDVARAYGAVCTPDPFLFDGEHRLAWQGRIDDALQLGAHARREDMAEAVELLLAGKPIDKGFLPSMGCSIKWR